MTWKLQTLALLAGMAAAGPVLAGAKPSAPPAPMSRQVYEARKTTIASEEQAARKLCKALEGHRKDLCEIEASSRADALEAELEARYKPGPEATLKAKYVTADANFAVAKAKCRPLGGDARDRCMRTARLAREAAIRQAKVEKVQETGGAFAHSSSAGHRKLPAGAS